MTIAATGHRATTSPSISVQRPNARAVLPLLAVLTLGVLVVAVAIGPVAIPLRDTLEVLLAKLGLMDAGEVLSTHARIVGELRLPRAIAAVLVGMALAVSGSVMQGIFRNPLASPYLLGVASGASAGAALVIVLGLYGDFGGAALPVGSFVGGTLAVVTVYQLAARRGASATTLILAGVALSALFSAFTSFLIVLSGRQMAEIVFWIMGGLGRARWEHLVWLLPVVLTSSAVVWAFSRDLNALALGDEGARHLGISPERVKRGLLVGITVLTGAAVASAGTIGFVGLITPHALRLIVGPDHRILLPASAFGGAIFLIVADTAARTAMAPMELPVGILTAGVGAPFFLYLLLNRRGGEMG